MDLCVRPSETDGRTDRLLLWDIGSCFLSYTIFLDFILYHLLHINNIFYTIICLFNNVLVTAYGVPLFFGMDWELPVDLKENKCRSFESIHFFPKRTQNISIILKIYDNVSR